MSPDAFRTLILVIQANLCLGTFSRFSYRFALVEIAVVVTEWTRSPRSSATIRIPEYRKNSQSLCEVSFV